MISEDHMNGTKSQLKVTGRSHNHYWRSYEGHQMTSQSIVILRKVLKTDSQTWIHILMTSALWFDPAEAVLATETQCRTVRTTRHWNSLSDTCWFLCDVFKYSKTWRWAEIFTVEIYSVLRKSTLQSEGWGHVREAAEHCEAVDFFAFI